MKGMALPARVTAAGRSVTRTAASHLRGLPGRLWPAPQQHEASTDSPSTSRTSLRIRRVGLPTPPCPARRPLRVTAKFGRPSDLLLILRALRISKLPLLGAPVLRSGGSYALPLLSSGGNLASGRQRLHSKQPVRDAPSATSSASAVQVGRLAGLSVLGGLAGLSVPSAAPAQGDRETWSAPRPASFRDSWSVRSRLRSKACRSSGGRACRPLRAQRGALQATAKKRSAPRPVPRQFVQASPVSGSRSFLQHAAAWRRRWAFLRVGLLCTPSSARRGLGLGPPRRRWPRRARSLARTLRLGENVCHVSFHADSDRKLYGLRHRRDDFHGLAGKRQRILPVSPSPQLPLDQRSWSCAFCSSGLGGRRLKSLAPGPI